MSRQNRRAILKASLLGTAGFAFGSPMPCAAMRRDGIAGVRGDSATGDNVIVESGNVRNGSAQSVILFFLCGGASHLDMWDLKPDAPSDY
ncbi:MAG: hypothetical protein KDA85_22665, partial [Planctomycetaceae bacterium]|nr:hypothetical protein [Planctomycetaceae bacterium]